MVFARYMAAKEKSREEETMIVDFVVVCYRSHSNNLKIPMQYPFSRPLIDSKGKQFQKSEIGLQIKQKDQTHHLIVCAMPVHVK